MPPGSFNASREQERIWRLLGDWIAAVWSRLSITQVRICTSMCGSPHGDATRRGSASRRSSTRPARGNISSGRWRGRWSRGRCDLARGDGHRSPTGGGRARCRGTRNPLPFAGRPRPAETGGGRRPGEAPSERATPVEALQGAGNDGPEGAVSRGVAVVAHLEEGVRVVRDQLPERRRLGFASTIGRPALG